MADQIITLPDIPNRSYLITDYGAIGDGIFDNSSVFKRVIEVCKDAGGGKVIIPAGVWFTGPIQLTSKLNLHLEAGALLLFSSNFDDYPLILSSFEGEETVRCRSPLDGEGLEHVAITGNGVIDGAGEAWRPVKRFKMTESEWEKLTQSGGVVESEVWWPTAQALEGKKAFQSLRKSGSKKIEDFEPYRDFLRPNLLSLRRSKYILIEGPTFQNSAAWCLHPWICEQITVRNITVRNPWFSQNGDGLDLESCRYGLVENCTFDVGDDAICLKSGKDEAGRTIAKPCEDITIRGCQVYSGHGGFVIGSEMSGGIRNIHISDCTFFGTDVGLRFKSTRGRGGIVEKITIDGIRMMNMKNEAIVFHMFYELDGEEVLTDEKVSEKTPIFRNIDIRNIICKGAKTAIKVNGLPEMPLANLTFHNLSITSQQGIVCSECIGAMFSNIVMNVKNGALFALHNGRNIKMKDISSQSNAKPFLYISGVKTKEIMSNSALQSISIATEVDSEQVKL
ncbi:glycoside hydrolase family 28 protein [Halalkalibacter alkalisediminis]|uniref:Glycoside hydrolase family 28 protein n=1 Tax=Halalkalibacter alkalisediminis TaxID=935616 RepID=A0ABV6NBW8_9BACI|nr:glycoside hydrolase family 28 protein [Halalkalibacter alkalisediminis]